MILAVSTWIKSVELYARAADCKYELGDSTSGIADVG